MAFWIGGSGGNECGTGANSTDFRAYDRLVGRFCNQLSGGNSGGIGGIDRAVFVGVCKNGGGECGNPKSDGGIWGWADDFSARGTERQILYYSQWASGLDAGSEWNDDRAGESRARRGGGGDGGITESSEKCDGDGEGEVLVVWNVGARFDG